jgi:hypothetical protein
VKARPRKGARDDAPCSYAVSAAWEEKWDRRVEVEDADEKSLQRAWAAERRTARLELVLFVIMKVGR